ncbi:Dienelactone hydrolase [Cordyceps militaris CM01]|uniref:Dienelactone hydrolase n=1 Tax=Cordyceps militaris (strain CM01) TaxID=983644 RepID=G3JH36_CORMM|nr:Dienelactone hydrolase [Cordyceps militaris CM01]EGX91592.1 Dienelactone hydrolase [Cordyceps militaris CM01]
MACADCFRGNIHNGKPKGEVGHVHGLPTYISRPPQGTPSRGVVVVIPDAFGWEFGNNRLLADTYAEKGGFTVYLPDFMNGMLSYIQTARCVTVADWDKGHAAPLRMFDHGRAFSTSPNILTKIYHLFWAVLDVIPFFYHCNPSSTFPVVKGFFTQLRKDEGATQSVGAAGFCWGGKHVVLLSQGHAAVDGRPLLDAGFTAHPSMLRIPSDIAKIRRPVSFALAAKDDQIPAAKAARLKALVEALPAPATGEAYVFERTGHGFAVRADLAEDDVAAQAARAEDQCIDWFNKHF